MNKFRLTIRLLAIATFMFAFVSIAQAQATRTWVSGVGDDANPCSRTAPCKTFAGAISKTATDGEIDALDPGGFGAVTITKAITIDGNGWGSILAAGTNGVIVNVSTPGNTNWVQLRNISINGAGTGLIGVTIVGGSGTHVSIENCVIFGFRGGSGRGVSDTRASGSNALYIADTLIKSNLNQGVLVSGAQTNKSTLERVNIWGNGIGVSVTGSTNTMNLSHCRISKNSDTGLTVTSSALVDVHDCFIGLNNTGIDASSSGVVKCARTVVVRNAVTGLGLSGGTILSYGNNEVSGNGGGETFSLGGPALK
jgi:parallel beta helix pectate lyase-like protein